MTESPLRSLAPLAIDVAVPVGGYFALRAGGVGLVPALAASSVVPLVRTVASALRTRSLNGLAALILAVNLVALATSFLTGNARLMFAKDAAVSIVVAAGILWSVRSGRPLMTAGLKPWLVKGDAAREARWESLAGRDRDFCSLERRYTLVWGAALLTDCVVRLVGSATLSISTLQWFGSVVLVGAIAVASIVSFATAGDRMEKMVRC